MSDDSIRGTTGYSTVIGEVVVKTILAHENCSVLEREVKVLDMLSDFDWCPDLISVDYEAREITMSYVGKRIDYVSESDWPEDFKDQMMSILDDLDSVGLNHNDLWLGNITLLNGKLHLIDFGNSAIQLKGPHSYTFEDNDFSIGDPSISSQSYLMHLFPIDHRAKVLEMEKKRTAKKKGRLR